MSLSKVAGQEHFGSPRPGKEVDSGKLKKNQKIAERVVDVLNTRCVYKEPKQLDPRLILVSELNRQGSAPNVQHLQRAGVVASTHSCQHSSTGYVGF